MRVVKKCIQYAARVLDVTVIKFELVLVDRSQKILIIENILGNILENILHFFILENFPSLFISNDLFNLNLISKGG